MTNNAPQDSIQADFYALASTITDIVYKIDQDGKFVYINSAVRKLGYEPDELIGKHFSVLMSPADVQSASRNHVLPRMTDKNTGDQQAPKLFDERRTAERKTSNLEIHLVPKGKSKKHRGIIENLGKDYVIAEVSSSGMYRNGSTKPKTFIGTIGVIKDVTGHRRMEAELMKYSQHMEDLVAIRTRALTRANKKIKRVLVEVKDSESLSKATIENSPTGIYIVQDGKFEYVNPSFAKILDCSPKQLIGKRPMDMVLSEDRESVRQNAIQKLKIGIPHSYEFRVLDASKNVRWIMEAVVSIQYKGKQAALGNVIDITDRKQAEDRLCETRDYLENLITYSNAPIIEWDTAFKITRFNTAFEKLTGLTNKEVIGKSLDILFPPENRTTSADLIRATASKDRWEVVEIPILHRDGSVRTILWNSSIIWNADGINIAAFVAQGQDITERRKSELQIIEQKELIDRILATTPSAVLVVDKVSMIVLANKAFYKAIQKEQADILLRPISEIIPERDLLEAISSVRAGENHSLTLELKVNLSGQEKICIFNVLHMGKDEVLITINDITEERERQERFYLTDRLASVGEMAAGIAHELNNPLTGIIGLAELLLSTGIGYTDEAKEDLRMISGEAQRAADVIKNLLTFARRHQPLKQTTQVNEVILNVLKLRTYEHRVNNITVSTQLDEKLPEIVADQFQLQQVFLNIILNAEQAMMEVSNRGRLIITTRKIGDTIRILFTDTGPGINPENMRKLFSPFFTTKEVGRGTGLGLSICYGIVTNHGGKIYARSEPGKGASFIIELPVKGYDNEEFQDANTYALLKRLTK